MTRYRQPLFWLTGLCVLLFTIAPSASADDAIAQAVERAESSFVASVAQAKAERDADITRAMQRAVDQAADRGDLDGLVSLQNQLKAFTDAGKLSAHDAAQAHDEQYHKKLARLGDILIRTYKSALRSYTQDRDIERARLMQAKLRWTRPTADLDTQTHDGHAYLLVIETKTWQQAKQACEELGGTLACLNDKAEHRFIVKKVIKNRNLLTWVGATDQGAEGDWAWLDGSDDYWPWFKGEPNNFENAEHFGSLNRDGTLNDSKHDSAFVTAYLCEWDRVPTRETIYDPTPKVK